MTSVQVLPQLDPLRTKLVTLIDQIQFLHSHLLHLSSSTPLPTSENPGILSFTELLSRYNVLLSGIVGLGSLLSDLGVREKERKGKESERDNWKDLKKARLEGAVVVPAIAVEEGKDWIVGMLLRTKQVRYRFILTFCRLLGSLRLSQRYSRTR